MKDLLVDGLHDVGAIDLPRHGLDSVGQTDPTPTNTQNANLLADLHVLSQALTPLVQQESSSSANILKQAFGPATNFQ